MTRTVAVAGLGAIGLPLARALDGGIDGLQLVAVAAHDLTKARAKLAGFRNPPALMNFADLADADIVVEAVPSQCRPHCSSVSHCRRSKQDEFSFPVRLARCCPDCIW
jgi:predicted dinucleotide-utilizing enzyme